MLCLAQSACVLSFRAMLTSPLVQTRPARPSPVRELLAPNPPVNPCWVPELLCYLVCVCVSPTVVSQSPHNTPWLSQCICASVGLCQCAEHTPAVARLPSLASSFYISFHPPDLGQLSSMLQSLQGLRLVLAPRSSTLLHRFQLLLHLARIHDEGDPEKTPLPPHCPPARLLQLPPVAASAMPFITTVSFQLTHRTPWTWPAFVAQTLGWCRCSFNSPNP